MQVSGLRCQHAGVHPLRPEVEFHRRFLVGSRFAPPHGPFAAELIVLGLLVNYQIVKSQSQPSDGPRRLVLGAAGGADVPILGKSAPLSVHSDGRIHHDKKRRDVCATRGIPLVSK